MLENLNDKQLEAIKTTEGPLVVLAGAGSGKTKVLTTRIAYLIKECGVNPYNILAITFTNKAAKEMKERIENLIGKTAIQASTFHSFGVKVLRENYEALGYSSNFVIMDSDDSLTLVKKILKDFNLDPKTFSPYMIRNKISNNKNEFVMPDEYQKFVCNEEDDVVYKVYKKYQEILFKNNSVDFDDLLILPIKLFNEHKDVLQKYQERYQYILIDEYQDTNHAQYLLTKMISAKYKNICVVGDDSQCLPKESKISTDKGYKAIENINKNDKVLTSIGFGKTKYSEIESIKKTKYKGNLIKVVTENNSFIATPEHITFCSLGLEPSKYYVYLMYKRGYGYRIGQTSSSRSERDANFNGIGVRTRGETGDKSWIIKVCDNKKEATYYEEYYSYYYGIPKVVFHDKGRGIAFDMKMIKKLYSSIDTESRAKHLMQDENLFELYPHHYAQSLTKDDRYRKTINISYLGGKHYKIDDFHSHRIGICSNNMKEKEYLTNLGFNVRKNKANTWRIETEREKDIDIECFAKMIEFLSEGYEIREKMHLLDDEPQKFMPVGSLRKGMQLVINNGKKLALEKIVSVENYPYDGYVYDINIKNTRNYFTNNVCVHNCIYGFRGSNYKNILNFSNDYKNSKTVLLEQNYRSTKTILNAANSVIKNNVQRTDKNLWSDNEEGDKLTYYLANNEIDEVFYVIRKVKELRSRGVPFKDISVLYRTNAQSRVFEQELLKANMPFRIIGSFYFYSRKEIKDLLAYLRLIYNTNDDISLMRCINTPKRGIGLKTISDIEEEAKKFNVSMYEAISSGKALEFKNIIKELIEKKEELTLTELIDLVLDKSGMKTALKEEKTLEADIRLENLEEFKSVTKTFEEREGIVSLEEFLLEVSLVSDAEEYKDDPNRLTLMTVHAVKGLEFPYVFIVGLEEGLFPHKNSYAKEELEEERRLMYVAITRAKKKLFLTSTKKRMIYGQEQFSILSRFVNEIDTDYLNKENVVEEVKIKKEDKIYDTDQEYKYGDKVMHDTYGVGVVIEINKTIMTVAFSKAIGIKKILKNHKSVRRI